MNNDFLVIAHNQSKTKRIDPLHEIIWVMCLESGAVWKTCYLGTIYSRKGGKGSIFFPCKKVGTVFTSVPASDNLHLESGRKVSPTPLPRENLETSFFYGSFIRLLGRRGAKIWPNFPLKKERIASRLRQKSVRQCRPQLGPGRKAIASELGNRELEKRRRFPSLTWKLTERERLFVRFDFKFRKIRI